jgi:integrase
MKIYYKVSNVKVKEGYPIRLYVNMNSNRIHVNTGVYVSNINNYSEGRVLPSEDKYKIKNIRLSDITKELDIYLLQNHLPEEIKNKLYEITGRLHAKKRTKFLFINYIDKFVSLKSTKGTINLYNTTRNKIIAFDPRVTIEKIDIEWLSSFEKFMSKTMSINGYSIHLRNIRAVFNYCIDEGITSNYPFRKYKIKHETTIKRSLTVDQLREIINCKCEKFQEQYRDLFILMFYLCGINAVDLFTIGSIDNQGRITYHRHKTGRLYSIKVEPEAMEIINKYRGNKNLLNCLDTYKDYKDYLHHFNNALGKLGKVNRLGIGWTGEPIQEGLTSYWARHTWATIAYELDIPHDIIGQALGHAESDTTDIYIRYNNKKIDEANRKVIDYVLKNI